MSSDVLYEQLRQKLHRVMPDFELRQKADVAAEILRLKAERNAVILGHNHPSGNVTPSPEDLTITNRIATGGELMGIQLAEHVIVSADGKSVGTAQQLGAIVAAHKPGDQLQLDIVRDGASRTVTVTLGDTPA